MVVQTLDRHTGPSGLIGLHIGALNVQQHFPRGADLVELELDHLCIVCSLEASFWGDQPEIHDVRLSSWLESKRRSGKFSTNPAPVAMIPNGARSFRLQILAKDEADHAIVSPSPVAYASQINSSQAVVDRRKHDVGYAPERRKKSVRLARLKGDELPSAATAN